MILKPVVVTLLAAVISSTAGAQEMPDMVGIWKGTFRAQLPNAVTTGELTIAVERQEGEMFSGHKTVIRDDQSDALLSANGKMVRDADERFIGILSSDGQPFYIAEVGDVGTSIGRFIDQDTIEVTYVESGDAPILNRSTLSRQ